MDDEYLDPFDYALLAEVSKEIDPADLRDLFAALAALREVHGRIGRKLLASQRLVAAEALRAAVGTA